MPKIKIHDLENRSIDISTNYISKLVPIDNHIYFPELKTQIILKPGNIFCSGGDNWIYVKETQEQIERLIAN
jgi:hypothetical protein